MSTTVQPATSFWSSLSNPFAGIGTSIGSGISKALGIAPTEADYRSVNKPTINVGTPLQALDATKINAANALGINLKTATSAQMTQVNAKAADFLKVGAGTGSLFDSPVLRSTAITSLGGTNQTNSAKVATNKQNTVADSIFGFLGTAISAVAPTLVQTGLAQYQYKNDPYLRAQRQDQQLALDLQKQQQANALATAESDRKFQLAQLTATADLEKQRIAAQLEATKASFAANTGSVVPPVNVPVGTVNPGVDGSMGVPTSGNLGQTGLLALLGGLFGGGAQPVTAPSVGQPIYSDLASINAAQNEQQAVAQAQANAARNRNLWISVAVAGVVGVAIWKASSKKSRRR